jgi:hypothetical protein
MLLMYAAWLLQSKAVVVVGRDGVRKLLAVDQLSLRGCLAAAGLRRGLRLFLALDYVVACYCLC